MKEESDKISNYLATSEFMTPSLYMGIGGGGGGGGGNAHMSKAFSLNSSMFAEPYFNRFATNNDEGN